VRGTREAGAARAHDVPGGPRAGSCVVLTPNPARRSPRVASGQLRSRSRSPRGKRRRKRLGPRGRLSAGKVAWAGGASRLLAGKAFPPPRRDRPAELQGGPGFREQVWDGPRGCYERCWGRRSRGMPSRTAEVARHVLEGPVHLGNEQLACGRSCRGGATEAVGKAEPSARGPRGGPAPRLARGTGSPHEVG